MSAPAGIAEKNKMLRLFVIKTKYQGQLQQARKHTHNGKQPSSEIGVV